MISREERTPLSEWWWTVDKPLLGAILVLMLTGVILSLARLQLRPHRARSLPLLWPPRAVPVAACIV